MPKQPPALRPAVTLFPAYPGDFTVDGSRLIGRFTADARIVTFVIAVTADLNLSPAAIVALINASPVTPLLLSITSAGTRRVEAAFAYGAHYFLRPRPRRRQSSQPALILPDAPTAVQLGMPFLPMIDLLETTFERPSPSQSRHS